MPYRRVYVPWRNPVTGEVEERVARPAAPNGIQVRMSYEYAGYQWTAKNLFWLQASTPGPYSNTDLTTVATGIAGTSSTTGWQPFLQLLTPSIALVRIDASDLTGLSSNSGAWTGTKAGTATGTGIASNVAAVISWQIAARYRGGKPRTYLPGVANNFLGGAGYNIWTTAFVTAAQAAAVEVLASINAILTPSFSVTMGVYSFYTGHALRPTPIFRPYTGAKVHERVDSQRRRSGKESSYP